MRLEGNGSSSGTALKPRASRPSGEHASPVTKPPRGALRRSTVAFKTNSSAGVDSRSACTPASLVTDASWMAPDNMASSVILKHDGGNFRASHVASSAARQHGIERQAEK